MKIRPRMPLRRRAGLANRLAVKVDSGQDRHSAGECAQQMFECTQKIGDRMKKMIAVALWLTGASLLWSPGVQVQAQSSAQDSIDQSVALLRQDLRSGKKQTIAASLQLADAEATKFWPIYDQYSAELRKLGDQRYALIKEYANGFGTLTDDQALSLIKRSLSLDEQVAQLRSKYVPIMNKVLPGTKTATFFQMDRYINSLIDLQVSGSIPLVQEQK